MINHNKCVHPYLHPNNQINLKSKYYFENYALNV